MGHAVLCWWDEASYFPNLARQDWYQPHPFGDLRPWECRFSTPTEGMHHTDLTLHQLRSSTGYVSNLCSRTPWLHPSDKIVQGSSAIHQRTFGKVVADGCLYWSYPWYCFKVDYDPSTGVGCIITLQSKSEPQPPIYQVIGTSFLKFNCAYYLDMIFKFGRIQNLWCIISSLRSLIWMQKWICSFTPRHLASMKSNSTLKGFFWSNPLFRIHLNLPIYCVLIDVPIVDNM